MTRPRAIPSRCDVCGGRLRAQYFRVFNRVSCSDVCTAVLYDREYDLPSGTTLNEMLYRRLQNKSKGVTVKTYRPVRRDRGGHLWLAGLFILGIVLWLLLTGCAPAPAFNLCAALHGGAGFLPTPADPPTFSIIVDRQIVARGVTLAEIQACPATAR